MKRNHLILFFIGIFLGLLAVINVFVSGIILFTGTNFIYILLWGAVLIFLILVMGLEKDRSPYGDDVLQIVFIYVVIYLIATYIFGLFFGFLSNPYNLAFTKILQNTIPVIAVIILQELVRFEYTSKAKENKFLLLFMTMIFILFDVSIGWRGANFTDAMKVYEFIGNVIVASITSNLLLTYISTKVGYKSTIMYRILFIIPTYIIFIWPDLGLYLQSLLYVIFPVILFLKLNVFLAQFKPIPRTARVQKMRRFLIMAPTYAIIIAVFIIVSGIFKIYGMAVASNSMKPTFGRGDMVIVSKVNDDEMELLQPGVVIAFYYEGRVLTHRIVEVGGTGKAKAFITKGDHNEDNDNWIITSKDVRGIVKYKIPIIGYPTVWLSEWMG